MMESKEQKIENFDPNGVGVFNGSLFGLPFNEQESDTIVIPVPWDVTVSYAEGTSGGPEAILQASPQLDLYDPVLPDAWKYGLKMLEIPKHLIDLNTATRSIAKHHIAALESGKKGNEQIVQKVNDNCRQMNDWVYKQSKYWIGEGKQVCLVGGDHSTPFGLIKAVSEHYDGKVGILQIDAHADLRDAYEEFIYSHASIMYNVLKTTDIRKLVQVGVRDICDSEIAFGEESEVDIFYDRTLKKRIFEGESWVNICKDIIHTLPQKVYISFDIDGLDPRYCPNTGTPVPGGLEFDQVLFLFEELVSSGREIVGFDLVEVAPGENEWDANVGARLLYRMNNLMNLSNQTKKV